MLEFQSEQEPTTTTATAVNDHEKPRRGPKGTGGMTTTTTTTTRRPPRVRGVGGVGEIVEVQGGHIIRAMGRKDRHSKVYTAKGPRDRRVRLSAHTAIQFYDVQDRLGYDRPSKAVDWLILKAKDAIDRLERLPPFHPIIPTHNGSGNDVGSLCDVAGAGGGGEGNGPSDQSASGFEIKPQEQIQLQGNHHPSGGGDGNNTVSIDSHQMVVRETMRSFFPTSTAAEEEMSSMGGGFHSYGGRFPHHRQDLGLSLHSFHDDPDGNSAATHDTPFQGGFEAVGSGVGGGGGGVSWVGENQVTEAAANEMGRFSRLLAWTSGSTTGFGVTPLPGVQGMAGNPALLFGERSNFIHNHHHQPQQQASIRAWNDLPSMGQHPNMISGSIINGSAVSDGFMAGFCVPTAAATFLHHGVVVANNDNKQGSNSMSTDSSH